MVGYRQGGVHIASSRFAVPQTPMKVAAEEVSAPQAPTTRPKTVRKFANTAPGLNR